jgi:hypothetical protein
MKTRMMLCALCCLLISMVAHATPVLVVGTPGDAMLSTPTKPSPNLGGTLLNFDSLTPFTTYSTYTTGGVSISSSDGLVVFPYSTQSGPNELFDNSAAGSANITISLTQASYDIGVGIADSDPVSIVIQALGLGGVALGSPFTENLSTTESLVNTGNGYYVLESTTPTIYGLQITEAVSNPNYSGLAIDDVAIDYTPEPPSFVLLATGLVIVSSFSLQKLKRA